MSHTELIQAEEALRRGVRRLASTHTLRVLSPAQAQELTDTQQLLAQAHTLLAQAQQEAEALRQQAFEQGRREGYREVYAFLEESRGAYREQLAQVEPQIIQLALEIAGRVIGRSYTLDPAMVAEVCAQALTHAQESQQVTLRVHPQDLHHLEMAQGRLQEGMKGSLVVEASDQVSPGGCHVETEHSLLEADLHTQLEVMAEALLGSKEDMSK